MLLAVGVVDVDAVVTVLVATGAMDEAVDGVVSLVLALAVVNFARNLVLKLSA